MNHTALDLFAGTGWGVACQRLGIREMGVENMPAANATRAANGMATIYRDVWDGLERGYYTPAYDTLIASPPCQTFSVAGAGAGRAALDEVLEAIGFHAYKDPQQLREFGERHDPRTALVLTPLAHVWRDRPEFVVFEQVVPARPVWEACAEVMRGWGYSVEVGVLNAEQYGVPQTRRRAILVARLEAPVALPVPTHSRYWATAPERLDPGVLPWVSMREALASIGEPGAYVRSNYGSHGDPKRRGIRRIDQPSATLTSKAAKNKWDGVRNMTEAEASALQTYPVAAVKNMGRGMVARHGERPGRPIDAPAFTLRASAGGTEPGGFVFRDGDDTTRKMTPTEASAFQTYPPAASFKWCGNKSEVFLQIGNAVPPRLGEAILKALHA